MAKDPVIIAVGGGKGGVGKSLISSGIATSLALDGNSTVCVDLDLGGANLHTFFGLRTVEKGIGDFIFRPGSRNLADYSVDCNVENLSLITGSGFIPGIANLYYFQKLKILRALKRLDFDYVVLDLGAGTNYNVIDFFSITRSGIVVTNPEPTAILNAYEFIKNVLFRIFSRSFKQGHIALEVIEAHKFGENQQQGSSVRDLLEQLGQVDQEAAATVRDICQKFKPCLVLNMVKSVEHSKAIAANLIDICRNFLEIELQYLGAVPRDETVSKQLVRLKNVVLASPESPAAKAIRGLAEKCKAGFQAQELKLDDMEEKEEEGQEREGGFKSSGNEKQDLASMLERFFLEFDREEARSGSTGPESHGKLTPINILDPAPRLEEEATNPVFLRDVELNLENFQVPSSLRELLSFISELTHMEREVEEKGQASGLKVTVEEIASAWFKTGLTLLESGQFSTAWRSFQRAARLQPDFHEATLNGASCLIVLGNIDEAVKTLSSLESAFSGNGAAASAFHFNKALAYFHQGRYRKVLEELENVNEGSPYKDRARQLRACCSYYLQRYKEAVELWKKCKGAYSLFNQALGLIRNESYEEAAGVLEKYLRENKGDAVSNGLLALCHYHLGKTESAMAALDMAISKEPANVRFRTLMAYFAYHQGQLDRAIREADIIARLRPANPKYMELVSQIKKTLV